MPKIIKFLLVILLFIGFFEAGLISSYTIVTSNVPDVKGLIDIQIETITNLFNPDNINDIIVKDPDVVNVANKMEVAEKLKILAKIDGVSIKSINATTYGNSKSDSFELTINALGYSGPNGTTGQIILKQDPQYRITATANGKYTSSGAEIDINSIKVTSVLNIYE
ncbi:MAG: hypothetical protein LBU74_05870 [Methanobacteriaceae archaeon]|jgi:citrate lyase alpha subunit|nr:hypothetical protein [Candidatus Methanorudis spinitermitis]